MSKGKKWLVPFGTLSEPRQLILLWISFTLPLAVWAIVSYVPFVWHPLVKIDDPGDVSYFTRDALIERTTFKAENAKLAASGGHIATGTPANPVFLPAPHEVAVAFYKSFTTPPKRKGDKWLHESLWQSIQVIFWGFLWSSVVGVPIGILCGTFPFFSRITEPFVDFTRYMPAPAFGALAVAVLGIYEAPKIAIIFIGTFFQQVLVIANTTRKLDTSLVEAAQTLGANRRQLLFRVVVPGIAVDLYNDMRILLGWAWTYLIVAEYIGASSGITFFINQQAKYRIYDNVFAAIIIIGIIGFTSDRILDWIGRQLFPWQKGVKKSLLRAILDRRRNSTQNTETANANA
ncbi:nitrate ABC transporter permease [Spartobacteria bacterium LR76]|nr:nitrate ABC transporter permease [Spartobacteria bacterium LR76]